MSDLISGQYIKVHQLNIYFNEVTAMLLAHFDTPLYQGTTFILGDYIHNSISHFRTLYPEQRLIVYQLEQMVGSETWHSVDTIVEHIREADEVWDYDTLNADFLRWHQIEVKKIVPMLYTESLNKITNQESPSIDLLFYGYINERRYRILRTLQQELYNQHSIVWVYGICGEALDRYIADSKIILNLHAFEPWHRQEQVRIFYPVINQKMVISEVSQKNYFDDCIAEAEVENLASSIKYWLAEERWKAHSVYAKHKFHQISAENLKRLAESA